MMPLASSFCNRSARMLVAIPSPDSSNSLNVRSPRTIRSRTISSDQRSPNISSDTLTGQPDRGWEAMFPATRRRIIHLTCIMQVIFGECLEAAQTMVLMLSLLIGGSLRREGERGITFLRSARNDLLQVFCGLPSVGNSCDVGKLEQPARLAKNLLLPRVQQQSETHNQ